VAWVHIPVLIGSALAIYLACEWFVNAVEWLGVELGIGETAVGTVLAAVGTALPESVVTLVAVVGHSSTSMKEVGVGAAMGGPLALSTIAYGVVGIGRLPTPWPGSIGCGSCATRAGSWSSSS